ncbi:Thiol-disulfide oxidoreductase resA [Candidatus Ornithobacterium hominis]|uniref:Thiol-disulfide oxidoreductase resA n=1 Tax=Candidatus Ornithobacterium hominis TaxID=2497989 RepID=A0A383TYF0_9FLAO|nr:redoxin family protein [Candidatus Ornithobacterium hominis]MCT7904179.1 redoxin family protein [Candidatus Ornithobacterium hominis]SZD72280.1 Thiol-disulfide oxidoreductase resA [Candidatus Ornithobacterium hominis]
MKNTLIAIASLLVYSVSAQFNIQGQIQNYENQSMKIKTYKDGILTYLDRINTDKKGNFSYHIKENYTGLVVLELLDKNYQLVANNANIYFETNYKDAKNQLNFRDAANLSYQKYLDVEDKKELAKNNLKPLKNYYLENTEFSKALEKEIKRIQNLEYPADLPEDLNYFIETKNYLSTVGLAQKLPSEWLSEINLHLQNDGQELENFGFLPQFVVSYISLSMAGAQSKTDADEKIKTNLNSLVDAIGADTPRGQSILAIAIPLLRGNGFDLVADDLNQKAESLTCQLNSALANAIKAPIKVGEKAPNIVFSEKKRGKKSLYEIKAKKKMVIFWGSWCPHCRNEIPFIKDFYENFKKQGGEIVSFALDSAKEDYLPLVQGADFITDSDLLKWDSPVARDYGVNATPTIFLLDENNQVVKIGTRVSEFVQF